MSSRSSEPLRISPDIRALINAWPTIVAIHAEGRILYANAAAAVALRQGSAESVIGLRVEDVVTPEELPLLEERDRAFAEGRFPQGMPYQVRVWRSDGSISTLSGAGLAVDFDGKPARLVVGYDDSERVRALAHLRAVFDHAIIGIVFLDSELRAVSWNASAASMLGWKGDWAGGPDRRPAGQLSILPHLSEAAASTGRAAAEFILEKMGGRRAILSLSVAALAPAEGLEGGGFILTIRDLTEARDAMSDLRKTGDALRAVFEASPLGIISFDRTEKVQVWNRGAERIFGWTATEAAANSTAVFNALGDVAKAAIGRAVRGESARIESPIRARSGEIDASLSIEPLRDAAGLPSGWIMAIEDVSARTRLENELRRSEAMSTMGAVVAGVAHEVRNPLFSITSALDAFGSMFADKPEALEFIGILRSEVRRLSHLMNELLDLSKPAPLAPTSVRLEDVVETVVRGQSQNAEQNSIELIHRAPQKTSRVRGDPARLEQVFQNLLENALQHAPAQSQIEMNGTAIKEAGEAAIEYEILDRGPGFREEDLPKLFQPFFSRRRDGTGLGLSIVQRVVEQHGGTVRAGNRPGGGAALVVRLPLADQHPAP